MTQQVLGFFCLAVRQRSSVCMELWGIARQTRDLEEKKRSSLPDDHHTGKPASGTDTRPLNSEKTFFGILPSSRATARHPIPSKDLWGTSGNPYPSHPSCHCSTPRYIAFGTPANTIVSLIISQLEYSALILVTESHSIMMGRFIYQHISEIDFCMCHQNHT